MPTFAEHGLCYWRSKSGFEVDFVLKDTTAIEVKAKRNVGPRDLRGLRALREEARLRDFIVVSLEATERNVDGIRVLPWQTFVQQLWQEAFI